jgi:hypothetical protein
MNNKMQLVKSIWGLSRFGAIEKELLAKVEDAFLKTSLLDNFNLKDYQTLLESLAAYEMMVYEPTFLDRVT